jgi:ribosomal protein S18 acetylase RimI-like enzyme
MRIRSFHTDDQPAVVDLWQQCGLLRSWNDPALDIVRKQSVGADLFLVGVIDDGVVASVMGGYDGHRGWMYYLAVSPSHGRRGLGQQMVAALELRLKAIGCPKVNLQVREDNREVVQFYRSIGYRQDATISFGKRLIEDEPTGR